MDAVIQKLKAKIEAVKEQIEGCRGFGMCSSDIDRMRSLKGELSGLKYALRVTQLAARK